jgi:hypothetical protein
MKNLALLALLLSAGLPLHADWNTIAAAGSIAPPLKMPGESYEVTKYKVAMRKALWSVWDREMRTNESSLWFGKVAIHCVVHSDGSLSDLTVTVGESTGLMKTVCRQSLLDSAPFKPFTDTMVSQAGSSFVDTFVFSVVKQPTGNGMNRDWSNGVKSDPAPTGSPD